MAIESEPIRITFVPSLIEQKRASRAAFIAERDKADAELWAQIAADRAARQARETGRWAETASAYWGCFTCGKPIPEPQVYCSAACRQANSSEAGERA